MKTLLSFLSARVSSDFITPSKLAYAAGHGGSAPTSTAADRTKDMNDFLHSVENKSGTTVPGLDQNRADNLQRIKDAKAGVFSRAFRGTLNVLPKVEMDNGKVKALDTAITDIAKARAAKMQEQFEKAESDAVKDITALYHKHNRGLALATAKIQVIQEISEDLEKSITSLQDLKGNYKKAIVALKGEKGLDKNIDDEKSRRDILKTLKSRATQEITDITNKQKLDGIRTLDDSLRKVFMQVDPTAAQYLDECILENVNGDGTKIDDKIEELRVANKLNIHQHKLLIDMSKALRGGKGGRFKPALLTGFYGQQIQKRGDVNPEFDNKGISLNDHDRMDQRLKKLSELPIGQWVCIKDHGAANEYSVMDKNDKYIRLVDRKNSKKILQISLHPDATTHHNQVTSMDTTTTPPAVAENNIGAPTTKLKNAVTGDLDAQPGLEDPTKVYFDIH